jgi:hypothetical protein
MQRNRAISVKSLAISLQYHNFSLLSKSRPTTITSHNCSRLIAAYTTEYLHGGRSRVLTSLFLDGSTHLAILHSVQYLPLTISLFLQKDVISSVAISCQYHRHLVLFMLSKNETASRSFQSRAFPIVTAFAMKRILSRRR